MNKKMTVLTTGTCVLLLGLCGCKSDAYTYDVSGTVEGAQVDYECGEDPSLNMVAFNVLSARATKKPGSESGGNGSGSTSRRTGTPVPKAKPSKSPAGVKLDKKPEKPERINSVPKSPKFTTPQKGCEVEYELFVRNDDGLFEQDVREVDYTKCSDVESEEFPACTSD